MRVPSPGLLKIDKEQLLKDVRTRLAEKYPDYADESQFDATDPAWVILEQAVWIAEMLSEQLDQYPFSMVQEFVHLMGGQLQPSTPSLGVVVLQPSEHGMMSQSAHRPSPWRFFTLQTEELDIVEFVPVEQQLSLRDARILSISGVRDGELSIYGSPKGDSGIDAMEAWLTYDQRSRSFDEEWVRYDVIASNADDLIEVINGALESLEKRKLGWLEFRVEKTSQERVSLFVRVNLAKAFEEDVPTGLTNGGDVRGKWGTLDDSIWTPPVRVADLPQITPSVRGTAPLPGLRRGTIIIPDVPQNLKTPELLQRKSQPLPFTIVESIWETLTHMDQRIAPLLPSISRGVDESEDSKEPTWISTALDKGVWSELVDRAVQQYVHIQVGQHNPTAGNFRFGFVLKGVSEDEIPDIRVFGIEAEQGIQSTLLNHQIAWRLKLPDPVGGQRMVLFVAIDVELDETHDEILVATECNPMAVLLNAALVVNAPAANDGRELVIERNVPEGINLLFDDIVNGDVINFLLQDSISSDTGRLLSRLALSHLSVSGAPPILDFEGVWLDPTSKTGEGALLRVNAPDRSGHHRQLRPGKRVNLDWYRRTDGSLGNVSEGSIQVVEQPPRAKPLILNVHNPLATFFGTERESELEAIDRMFSPSSGVPVLPTDWERLIRVALGVKARGWVVRCWAYAERNLVSTSIWPVQTNRFVELDALSGGLDRDRSRLMHKLQESGPETLLIVVGSSDRVISDAELDWAHGIIRGLIVQQSRRLPLITNAISTKFIPLLLNTSNENTDLIENEGGLSNVLPLPCFNVDDLRDVSVDSTLSSLDGSETSVEQLRSTRVLLNAAVVDYVGETLGGRSSSSSWSANGKYIW